MAGIHVKRRMLIALLCVALLLTTAFAFAPQRSDISIRITPPEGVAARREVEIQFTDNAGTGLQAAHVKLGGASWHEITGQLNRTDNCYRYIAEITENCTVTARAIGQDGTVFEKSEEISCFDGSAGEDAPDETADDPAEYSPSKATDVSDKPDGSKDEAPLTPKGQASVLDNATEEDGKEFFTFTTPNENTFFLVVDRQKDNDNVYFLNSVTESDLAQLAEKDGEETRPSSGGAPVSTAPAPEPEPEPEPVCVCKDKCAPGEVNTKCTVCTLSYKDCEGTAPAPEETGEKNAPKASGTSGGGIMVVLLAALIAGGAGYYFKIYKRKRELDEAEELDELTAGEEVTINEDDMYAEPDEAYAGYSRAGYSGEDEEPELDESDEADEPGEPERMPEPEPLNSPEPSVGPEPPGAEEPEPPDEEEPEPPEYNDDQPDTYDLELQNDDSDEPEEPGEPDED